jgi:hypothetical protein
MTAGGNQSSQLVPFHSFSDARTKVLFLVSCSSSTRKTYGHTSFCLLCEHVHHIRQELDTVSLELLGFWTSLLMIGT